MGTPITPLKLDVGERVANFIVKKKVGEGACGQVFLVNVLDKEGKVAGRAAMKVEPKMQKKEDEVLKMEIFALQRLQKSRHVCRILGSGHAATFTYVVMSLLGRELFEIRRRLPQRKMQANSVIRLGIQLIRAFQDVHEAGFVHRDVKPSNMAVGYRNNLVVYVFDFGLARQILIEDRIGNKKLRDPRSKVMFRGTVRYCSLNVHKAKEQGRHDDLFGLLYSLIECVTGTLPWKGKLRKDSEKIKQATPDTQLCKDCPPCFLEMSKKLKILTYYDTPPYSQIMNKFKQDLPKGLKMTDPYEWTTTMPKEEPWEGKTPATEKDHAEADRDNTVDEWTTKDVEDSVVTEEASSTTEFDPAMSKEDTLDNL